MSDLSKGVQMGEIHHVLKFMDETPNLKTKQFSSNDEDTLIDAVAGFVHSKYMNIKSITIYPQDSDAWYGFVVYEEREIVSDE